MSCGTSVGKESDVIIYIFIYNIVNKYNQGFMRCLCLVINVKKQNNITQTLQFPQEIFPHTSNSDDHSKYSIG